MRKLASVSVIALVTVTALAAVPSLVACGASSGGGAESPNGESHPLVGKKAPTFALSSVNGSKAKIDVASLGGKVVIVDFWATWCGPCKESFPKLQELAVKYKGQVEIVGVSQDEDNPKQSILDFASTTGAKFPLVWDDGKSVADQYKPPTMPSSFLVDKNGVVRFVHVGWHPGDEQQIEEQLKSLL